MNALDHLKKGSTPTRKKGINLYRLLEYTFILMVVLVLVFIVWKFWPSRNCELCKINRQYNQAITEIENGIIEKEQARKRIQEELSILDQEIEEAYTDLDIMKQRKELETHVKTRIAKEPEGLEEVTLFMGGEEVGTMELEKEVETYPYDYEAFIRYPKTQYSKSKRILEHKSVKDPEKVEAMNIAYQLGGMDFVTTLDQENGQRGLKVEGDAGTSIGLCQLQKHLHKEFIESPYFLDYEKQVVYCYDVRQDAIEKERLGNTFSGYLARRDNEANFYYVSKK